MLVSFITLHLHLTCFHSFLSTHMHSLATLLDSDYFESNTTSISGIKSIKASCKSPRWSWRVESRDLSPSPWSKCRRWKFRVVEDFLTELLLAHEESSDADLGGFYLASDFVLELLPLEALNFFDAELFNVELAEAHVYGGFSHTTVDLDVLAEVAKGEHALDDVAEVVDGVGGDQIDLADAASGTVIAAVNGIEWR